MEAEMEAKSLREKKEQKAKQQKLEEKGKESRKPKPIGMKKND